MEGSSFIGPLPRFEEAHPLRAIQAALQPMLVDTPEVVELRRCLRRRDLMRVALSGLMRRFNDDVVDDGEDGLGLVHEVPEKGELIMEGCQAILNKLQHDDGTPIRLRPCVLKAINEHLFSFLKSRPEMSGGVYVALGEEWALTACLCGMSARALRGKADCGIFASTGLKAVESSDAVDGVDTEPRPVRVAADDAALATRA
jgi:hypothetical protein